MNITNLNQIERKPELRIRKIQEQYYIFDRQSCYSVNMTGAMIVHALGKDMLMQAFVEKLANKFNVSDGSKVEKDVAAFIGFLEKEGLVSIK